MDSTRIRSDSQKLPGPPPPLRGCPLSTIMLDRSFLRDSESHSDDSFDASVPVSSVDFFLSHSWSADGFWKQMAIFICSSTSATYKIMVFSSVAASYLFVFSARSRWREELIASCLGFVSFLISLVVIPLYNHRNTIVFLDKCCIQQKDPTAKSYGISRLAEYLCASDKLLILWSPDYLDRLWCVYELAVFLRTHDKEDVIVVNLDHLKLCVTLMLTQFMSILILDLAEEYISSTNLHHIGCVLGLATSLFIGHGAFACNEEWQSFCSSVKCFRVRKAKCSSTADYSRLKKLITDMCGSEAEFEAVVKGLCLGQGKNKHVPTWLFSRALLRLMLAPHIPFFVARTFSLSAIIRGESTPTVKLYDPDEAPEPLPSIALAAFWYLRLSTIPILMMSFRTPLMLLVGHKLAISWIFKKMGRWYLGITFAITFGAYNCLTQVVCGLHLFYHPIHRAPISGWINEGSLWITGIGAAALIFSLLRRSYPYELPNAS
ncbi:hypothetical protein FOZ61_001629 [Perkinsus olseni]|uniref:TIR domain-containing protein n=1 Tax=Perkinsus olseni TaxID=32597 RepID=A0A7J6LWB3_PEROL|nr:hypothetical protein FOZ61_001629 [Perkinsus olseni]